MMHAQALLLRRFVVPTWSALLVLAIGLPWLRHGYVLSYDMVWVPRLDLHRPELWGLGTGLPRAVPSDAVAALAGAVLPAEVVQRLALLGALFLLPLGTARLLASRPLAVQLAAATFAVWNPYVVERLVLGQWPMLLALAGFPWLVWALLDRAGPHWPVVVVALAATALTPASGVMGVVLAICAAWRLAAVRVTLLAALVNAPWVVAGLRDVAQARTDPAAVGLFEGQAEGMFGRLGSAVTLGGIWNTEVVPTSRTLPLAVVLAVVMGLVMLRGTVVLWRDDRRLLVVTGVAGLVGLAVAVAGWSVPDLVARVVADVPAGGLVRDGTRWLALLVPVQALAFGAGAGAVLRRVTDGGRVAPFALVVALLPVAALPDAAWGVSGRLQPVDYPSSWASARLAVEASPVGGDVVVLPFSAYRRPAWNRDVTVLDPAGRYFDRSTVTDDRLEVSGKVIRGEDQRAASVGRALDSSDPLPALARRGIGIVVVETDAPGADEALRVVGDAPELAVSGTGLRVFTIDGARARTVPPDERRTMTLAWGAAGGTVLLGLVGLLRGGARSLRRLHRKASEHRARKVPQA